jgi:hypothetical protein
MAKTVATILGAVFVLLGLLGFLAPGLLGAHLSMTHNVVHLVSGALALYFGLAARIESARIFDLAFGVVYGLLGVAGFLFGAPGQMSSAIPGPHTDANVLTVIPGALELGTMDHTLHVAIGAIFIVGALLTRGIARRAGADRDDHRPNMAA